MPEGLPSLADAFAETMGELDAATSDAPLEDLPSEEEQPVVEAEQAEEAENQEQPEASEESILDLLKDEQGDDGNAVEPYSEEWWRQEIDINTGAGVERVSLGDLRDGYLRQSDYTRKTQELARERKLIGEAAEFHKAFKEDPQGFAKYLAVRAGLLDEDASAPDGVKLYSADDIEAEVEKRLEEAVKSHPDVKAAQERQAVNQVAEALSGIEDKYGVKLTREHKVMILTEAQKRNTADLELVYEALLTRAQRIAAERSKTKSAAPARPTAAPRGEQPETRKVPASVQEAMAEALAELSGEA